MFNEEATKIRFALSNTEIENIPSSSSGSDDASSNDNDDTDLELDQEEEEVEARENYFADLEIEMSSEEEELESDQEMNSEGNDDRASSSQGGYETESDQSSSGNSSLTSVPVITSESYRASDLLLVVSLNAEINKMRMVEESLMAMDELVKKVDEQDRPAPDVADQTRPIEVHELEDLMRMVEVQPFDGFDVLGEGSSMCAGALPGNQQPAGSNQRFHREASREVAIVDMRPLSIVQMLVDTGLWSSAFSDIVTRATHLGVVLQGREGSYDGLIQVISAEFHLNTPLVTPRKSYFARFCKLLPFGRWGVVDVSLENILPISDVMFRRKPSGCVIQELPDGRSKVTWVEEVEADNRFVNNLFRHIVTSGFAFGANRWLNSMVRHSHWIRTWSAMHGVNVTASGRDGLLNLSDRMRRNYFQVFSGSSDRVWSPSPLIGSEDVMLIRHSNSLCAPSGSSPAGGGSTVAFTTSVWLPNAADAVFNFLRHENSRPQWDLLMLGGRSIREVAHVINGDNAENRVSVLQVNSPANQTEIMYLQESYMDEIMGSSYVVFTPLDVPTMSIIMRGGNPDHLTILSSGFTVLPHKLPSAPGEIGSILTVGFHIADHCTGDHFSKDDMDVIDNVLKTTVGDIRHALSVFY